MDSLTFLDKIDKAKPLAVYAVIGDEDFLKRQVLAALKARVLGEADEAFGFSSYPGEQAEYSSVRDELATAPFLGSRRLVVVENADKFVTTYRAALEKYVESPSATGVLVLDVKTWPANTRLAKALSEAASVVCKTPTSDRLAQWCVQRAAAKHGKQLTATAAQLMVDLVGPEMGQLDQELDKLAVYVGDAKRIGDSDVDTLVGRSREADTFKIFDAIGSGRISEALTILDQRLDQGDQPLAILSGAISWQLRRLIQATRLSQQGRPLSRALADVGIPPFKVKSCEQLIRHLGLRRIERLYDWLLEADLGLKGSSALSPRLQLERLLVRLARPREGGRA